MNNHTAPKCPQCGFTILNKRFRQCEQCAEPLPEAAVVSAAQLKQLLLAEAALVPETPKPKQRPSADHMLILAGTTFS
jgi:hypothetical protein